MFVFALWSAVGKGLASWLSYVMFSCVFYHFPIRCPGSGVVVDGIDSDLCLLPYFTHAVVHISCLANSYGDNSDSTKHPA